jgi:hypothetical protein
MYLRLLFGGSEDGLARISFSDRRAVADLGLIVLVLIRVATTGRGVVGLGTIVLTTSLSPACSK